MVVAGVGTAGCRTVSALAEAWPEGPEMVVIHTQADVLWSCRAPRRIQIGASLTGGLSTGGDAALGRQAAEEESEKIREIFEGVHLAFIVLGLGGGTGTGAGPVVAAAAREAGALTLAVATLPFSFEGTQRQQLAEDGLRALQEAADAVVVLPNQRLANLMEGGTSLADAFREVDRIVGRSVRALWYLLTKPGIIRLDFQDLRTLAKQGGGACVLACGEAEGRHRARLAVEQVLNSPLLENGKALSRARGLLVGLVAGPDTTLADVQDVMSLLTSGAHPEVHVIMGAAVDPAMEGKIALTVLAAESYHPENAQAASPTEQGAATRRSGARGQQEKLELESAGKGRFKDVEPTIYNGQDLDTPTFVRRGIRIAR